MTEPIHSEPSYAVVTAPAVETTEAPPIQRPTIPAHVARPQDHQRPQAGRAEAVGGTVDVTFEGLVYRVEIDKLNDLDILEQVEDGMFSTVLRSVLGQQQWDQYKDSKRTPDGRAVATGFDEFINAIFNAVEAGKS